MKIVILGLSITSSWGNGHATTYRGLVRELAGRGHEVLFLERDQPWYARAPRSAAAALRRNASLRERARSCRRASAGGPRGGCVIVGSFVPEGVAVGEWVTRQARGVTAFYDIDTPVTLAKLAAR